MRPTGNSTIEIAAHPTPQQVAVVPSDVELLRQVGHGAQDAFRELVNRHSRYLYGIASSLTGNSADAEDVVQETFVAVINSKFRGESAVRTWLVQILIRRVAMLRRSKRRAVGSLTLASVDDGKGVVGPGAGGSDVPLVLGGMF